MQSLPLPILFAWRLTKTATSERSISIMIHLCFWGIFISTCALALVAAVMHGFEEVTHQSIQGIHADLTIRSSQPLDYEKIAAVIKKEFSDSVATTSPSSMHHVVIKQPTKENFSIAFLTAIDPQTARQTLSLEKRIVLPRGAQLPEVLDNSTILIGKSLAQELLLTIGDTIELLYPQEEQTKRNRLNFDTIEAKIGGIFATGIDEYDMQGLFASQAFVQEHFQEDDVTTITMQLAPHATLSDVQKKLARRLGLPVLSWKELYPPLMAALLLEKYAMILILFLIVLVASMNTISLLFMFITHKRKTVGLLFAMGMSRGAIASTFICLGMGLTLSAACAGLLLAIIISYLLNTYQLISLPDIYYVSYLPAHMNMDIILWVLMLVLILGFFTAWYPTTTMNRKKIAQVLKFNT